LGEHGLMPAEAGRGPGEGGGAGIMHVCRSRKPHAV